LPIEIGGGNLKKTMQGDAATHKIIDEIESWPFVCPGWVRRERNYGYIMFTSTTTTVDIRDGKIKLNGTRATLQDVHRAVFEFAADQLKLRSVSIFYFHVAANNIIGNTGARKIVSITPDIGYVIIRNELTAREWFAGDIYNIQNVYGPAYPLLPRADKIVEELTYEIDSRGRGYYQVVDGAITRCGSERKETPAQLTYMITREDVLGVIRTLPQPIAEEIEAIF